MQSVDLNQSSDSIKSQLNALKTFIDVSKSDKQLKKKVANSEQQSNGAFATQLNQISGQQKRYQRNQPNSTSNLLSFLSVTNGSGSSSLRYIRKKILEAAVKIQPQVKDIITKETLKILGCSQEQTFLGLNPGQLPSFNEGIYIPVQSLDLLSNLKNSPTSPVGKIFFEKGQPLADTKYKPFGGTENFPLNKLLYNLTQSPNVFVNSTQFLGTNYQGKSTQPLFNIQYTQTNQFGIPGDYYRVILLNREDTNGNIANTVGSFIADYYETISLVDPVDIGSQLINLLTGAINIKTQVGVNELTVQNKFELIIQRILGLCFDNRREIDVSGNAKIAELDGVDDSFFEFNDIDLRNIDISNNNTLNGVVEFEDCDNIKLPVNFDVLVDELINFRETLDDKTDSEKVEEIEKILDSVTQNPDWTISVPSNLNVNVSFDTSVIKKIPLAIVSGILTPKVLLPIFTLIQVVKNVTNYADNLVDFSTQYRKFLVEVVSQVNAIFLEILFELLKKDIVNLLGSVVQDIQKYKTLKKVEMILRLVQIAIVVSQLISDYRKCKSLLNNILSLLRLISGIGPGINEIPAPLLALSPFLPGTSPERSTINTIQELQSLGIPTGPLPDGSPNLMLLFNLATNRGSEKEKSQNGKIEGFGLVPPITGGYVKIFGKPI
jgi:hypothetical protein